MILYSYLCFITGAESTGQGGFQVTPNILMHLNPKRRNGSWHHLVKRWSSKPKLCYVHRPGSIVIAIKTPPTFVPKLLPSPSTNNQSSRSRAKLSKQGRNYRVVLVAKCRRPVTKMGPTTYARPSKINLVRYEKLVTLGHFKLDFSDVCPESDSGNAARETSPLDASNSMVPTKAPTVADITAAGVDNFDSWLSFKLRALNTDENVFGSYIKGILEGEETLEDKTEALEGILSEMIVGAHHNVKLDHCREILDKWKKLSPTEKSVDDENAKGGDDMDVRLAKLLESQPRPTTVQRTYTEEERKIREAILAQYSQMSDEEESGVGNEAEPKENGMMKNTNASVVQQAEKEKREKSKLDSQKKKDKDKEDR
uniref:Coiled-coil domain-containing protein 43 n=1 Tax=Timema californicum TaxID=61474 RepID=A0A7R9IYD7_TIMCA|nr:unnamed protein product [Timema californicum]